MISVVWRPNASMCARFYSYWSSGSERPVWSTRHAAARMDHATACVVAHHLRLMGHVCEVRPAEQLLAA